MITPYPDFDKWIKEENTGRRQFFIALMETGIDNLQLFKNDDPYGVDVLIMLKGTGLCVGVLEIENSTGNTWNYQKYYKEDQCLPPRTWRQHGEITIPYRRLPRFIMPDDRISYNGTSILLPPNWQRRFYQKWDKSLTAFYLIDFSTVRASITKNAFLYKPNNQSSSDFRNFKYEHLFATKKCSDFWREDVGNWFINIFNFLPLIHWGAFGNDDYPLHKPVKHIWERCGIKHKRAVLPIVKNGQLTFGGF